MSKRVVVALLCGLLVFGASGGASGHSGGLDQDGGHHCRQRGYDAGTCSPVGSYHCHQCAEEERPAAQAPPRAQRRAPAPAAPADTEPPSRPVVHQAETAGSRVTLTVSAERASRLTVATGSQVLHRATATGDPQPLVFTVPDGAHELTVTATDAAGNASPGAASKVTIDSVAPPPPSMAIEPAGAGSPDTKVRVTGEAGGVLRVQALRPDGTAAREWTEQTLSSGSAVVALRLPNGAYAVQALVVDRAGNASAVTSVPADVAIAKPGAPRLRVTSDKGASPVRIEVTGDPHTTATVAIVGAERMIERTAALGPDGRAAVSAPLRDGTYQAEAVLKDFQEQASAAGKLKSFLVKSAAPALEVVPIEEAMDGGRIAVALLTEKGAKLRVTSADGSVDETLTGSGGVQKLVVPAGSGAHTLRFVAIDQYGNRAELTRDVLVSEEFGAGDEVLTLATLGAAGWGLRAVWRRRRVRRSPAGA